MLRDAIDASCVTDLVAALNIYRELKDKQGIYIYNLSSPSSPSSLDNLLDDSIP